MNMEVEEALKPVANEVDPGKLFLIYNFGMGLKTPHKVGPFAKVLSAMYGVAVFLVASSEHITFFGCSVPESRLGYFTALLWGRTVCEHMDGSYSGSSDGCHAQGSFKDCFIGATIEKRARIFAEKRMEDNIILKD